MTSVKARAMERLRPTRPAITPAFSTGVSLWAACAACYTAGRAIEEQTCFSCAIAFGFTAVLASAAGIAKSGNAGVFVVAGALLGACLGFGFSSLVHTQSDSVEYGVAQEGEILLLEDSRKTTRGERALASIASGPQSGIKVMADLPGDTEYRYGQMVVARYELSGTSERSAEYSWQRGARCSAKVSVISDKARDDAFGMLLGIRNAAIDAIGARDDAHALLQALVCGYRRTIRDTERYTDFQTCGLAHLVAVSGAHLVIVTGLFSSLLRALKTPRGASAAILVAVMMSYLVVAGAPVSALRAVAMSILGLMSFVGRRRSSSMNALGIGIIAIILQDPSASVSASFALSALSTAGIVVFSPLFEHALADTPLARIPTLADSLTLTASASLLSQLYACSLFSQLPLVSPLANTVVAPLFPIVCALGLLASLACLLVPPVAPAVLIAAAGASSALEWAVGIVSSIPFACVPFAIEALAALGLSGVAAIALWIVWPCTARQYGMCCAALIAVVAITAIPAFGHADRIVMLDVGQGDSFLLESRGQTLLIDTGNQDSMLLKQLGLLRMAHIDSVLITHADDDHFGSLDVLDTAVDIDRAVLCEGMLNCRGEDCEKVIVQAEGASREIASVKYRDTFEVGAFEARVVWPREYHDGGNADSLCLYVEYDGDDDGSADFTALFTGDAESEELESMISSADVGPVDVLKVGHHGSRNGMTEQQVKVLSPKIALIGVGRNNRYGHPTAEILTMLENVGAKVYRSDVNGQVECAFTPDSISATPSIRGS